jgi:hypothetical protein
MIRERGSVFTTRKKQPSKWWILDWDEWKLLDYSWWCMSTRIAIVPKNSCCFLVKFVQNTAIHLKWETSEKRRLSGVGGAKSNFEYSPLVSEGPFGAIVSELSSASEDAGDIFSDPAIVQLQQKKPEKIRKSKNVLGGYI